MDASLKDRVGDALREAGIDVDEDRQQTFSDMPKAVDPAMVAKLKQIVTKIERLEEEKAEVAGHIKDEYDLAKSQGYDTKALRKVVSLRRQDRQKREEEQSVLDTYLLALGEI